MLTNAHVLRGDEVAVTRADGQVVDGRVTGTDPDLDVAVVELDTGGAPAITWDPARLATSAPGLPVFALADPGGRGLRTTFGLVTATGRSFRGPRGRRIGGSLEHSAPLPRGSSGGPLVDAEGRFLGINTVRLEGGLILALPADETCSGGSASSPAAPRPRVRGSASRSRRRAPPAACAPRSGCPSATGCSCAASRRARRRTPPASSAATSLVAAGGRPVTGFDDLFDALEVEGGTLTLTVVRGTEERDVAVTLS